MKFKNKISGYMGFDILVVLMVIVLALGICTVGERKYKKRMAEVEVKQEEFKREYIKENPLMIPLINAYYECQNKPYEVVEGCLDNTAKNAEEKQKLQKYLHSLGDIYMEGLK